MKNVFYLMEKTKDFFTNPREKEWGIEIQVLKRVGTEKHRRGD